MRALWSDQRASGEFLTDAFAAVILAPSPPLAIGSICRTREVGSHEDAAMDCWGIIHRGGDPHPINLFTSVILILLLNTQRRQ